MLNKKDHREVNKIVQDANYGNLLFQLLFEILYRLKHIFFSFTFGYFFRSKTHIPGTQADVVLVPGLAENGYSFQNMRNILVKNNYSVHTIFLGFQLGSLYKKSKILENYLQQKDLNNCYIIGHSMGGLISLNMNNEIIAERVKRIITLGTPYKGSMFAYILPFIPAVRSLIPGSSLLKIIQNDLYALNKTIRISSVFDGIVVPTAYSRLNEQDIISPVVGHLNIFKNKGSIKAIVKILDYFESL